MITPAARRRLIAVALLLVATPVAAQTVTSPRQQFGFSIGDDYQLATYTQFTDYWRRLDRESPRMTVVDIGATAEGRRQLMAIITSPENHRRLDRLRTIARRLATADGLDDAAARALAREGKAVVWIDGGLHANEVLGAHQLIETVYQLVSRTDAETQRLLNDVVVLAVHANPDGMELVSRWYMREEDPRRRSMAALPRLYQKYIGHDNNRDFYMSTQPETANMNRVMYREWFPQIVYNHHQTGPAGTVMFAPPFRDPFNYHFDPLVPAQLDLVAAAMHSRFATEGKAGVTSRKGASYSTWWNGGLRTTAYFHNMIGLLTETIGSPTPMAIPFVAQRHLPDSSLHAPIAPQEWRFRQSIEYSLTANWAVLDAASRYRETLLYNIYRMGRNSIERGSRDSWTPAPRRVLAAQRELSARTAPSTDDFARLLRDPSQRDPRGFIIPLDQPDFPTATKFVNALLETGVIVHRATAPFSVGGTRYAAGSYIVQSAQPFRPHVLDMFEPQDHPDDVPFPGGPPLRPYDSAGWTLAFQMGVRFDRVLDGFDGPFEPLRERAVPPAGVVAPDAGVGYLVSRAANDAVRAANRLLAAGERVWSTSGTGGGFFIERSGTTRARLEKIAAELGVSFTGVSARPEAARPVSVPRIALADHYGGSMPSGWTRWLLEQFEFPFEVVYPRALAEGDLAARYDVIIFPSGVGPAAATAPPPGASAAPAIPAEYDYMRGEYLPDHLRPQLQRFLAAGGTVLAVGRSSSTMGQLLELPVTSHLTEFAPDGPRALPAEKFYVPGSVLRVTVDTSAALATGLEPAVDVFFDNSPVFRLLPAASAKGVRPVAWFGDAAPLRSGWALGQRYLEGGVQVIEAPVGAGSVYLFAPEITFRAQPHGTFKFLFNAIYLAGERRRN